MEESQTQSSVRPMCRREYGSGRSKTTYISGLSNHPQKACRKVRRLIQVMSDHFKISYRNEKTQPALRWKIWTPRKCRRLNNYFTKTLTHQTRRRIYFNGLLKVTSHRCTNMLPYGRGDSEHLFSNNNNHRHCKKSKKNARHLSDDAPVYLS